jgi:hypothetical protein
MRVLMQKISQRRKKNARQKCILGVVLVAIERNANLGDSRRLASRLVPLDRVHFMRDRHHKTRTIIPHELRFLFLE